MLVLLALAIATDVASIALILVAMFLLGTAEVFADNTAITLLPMLVHRDDLAIGNARIRPASSRSTSSSPPPIGALLFAVGRVLPFAAEAVVMLLARVLITRITLPPHGRDPDQATRIRHDIVEGLRWVWHHAAVRTLVLTILIFNVTFGAAWSVLVLYATERLGLGASGSG